MLSRLLAAAVLAVACGPSAQPVAPASAVAVPSREPAPVTPAVLWTAPPAVLTSPPTPGPTDAPPPAPVAVAAPRPPDPPRLRPTPTAAPTPTEDPFRWTPYTILGGPTVYVPAEWSVIPPEVLRGAFAFAASPESPHASLAEYQARVTADWIGTSATLTLAAFADAFAAPIATFQPTRYTGPSGSAVFFGYRDPAAYQHVDALLAAPGRIVIIRTRAPASRWAALDSTFAQIVRRVRVA